MHINTGVCICELILTYTHAHGESHAHGMLQARPNTGVIWVDAHADINTPEVSQSGNIHGMPVAFLMQLCDPLNYPGWSWMKNAPLLRPQQIVYIGEVCYGHEPTNIANKLTFIRM